MAHRAFKDRQGRIWDVWAVHRTTAERRTPESSAPVAVERRQHAEPRASLPPELRNGWLAFESQAERRRYTPPPEAWEHLSDDALIDILDRATLTGKVRRL